MKRIHFLLCVGILFTITNHSLAQEKTEESRLKLLFVGDIMGHGPQIKSAYNAKTNTYNYNPVFRYVKPIIESADLAIGNLEVTLPGKPPYKGYPMFRSPDALAGALRTAGFDMLVTSNNHSNDGGLRGVNHTIDVLKEWGFHQTGTFKNQEERDAYYPLIVYKNDFRLAFLNYTYDTNGLPTTSPAIVNLIDEDLIKEDIEYAKKLKPDFIFVVMHWGLEYQLNENSVQSKLAKKMLTWGADMVVGAHPHVVQPIKEEFVTLENGQEKSGLVVYSMGNFISNQQKTYTDGGIIFETELIKNKTTQKVSVGKSHYIPVWRYLDKSDGKPYGTYYALPVSALEDDNQNVLKLSDSNKKRMIAYANHTRDRLNKYDATERKLTLTDIGLQPQPKAEKMGFYPKTKLPEGAVVKGLGKTTQPTNYYMPQPVLKNHVLISAYNSDTSIIGKPFQNTTTTENTTKGLGENSPKRYRIQFQSTRNMYASNNMPFIDTQIEEADNGWFRYYTGNLATLTEAQALLIKVQEKGFTDAFITTFKKTKSVDLSNINTGTPPPMEYNNPSDNTAKGLGQKTYKIQFQSTNNLYTSKKKNIVFDDVEIHEVNGRFKYYTGNATTLEAAREVLKVVRYKGFQDAFIVVFEDGQPK